MKTNHIKERNMLDPPGRAKSPPKSILRLLFISFVMVATITVTVAVGTLYASEIVSQFSTAGMQQINNADLLIGNSSQSTLSSDNHQLEKEKSKILAMDWDEGVDISFFIKDLRTGDSLSYNNKRMNSASLIKLFIMVEAYERDDDGTIPLTSELKKSLEKMITKSDNEASRKLTDVYYPQHVEKINHTSGVAKNAGAMKRPVRYTYKGFPNTVMERKMHDVSPPGGSSGYENWTSVEDVGKLLELIYDKKCVSQEASIEMLSLLQRQVLTNKIPKLIIEQKLPVVVANKTGELDQVENDAAIITGTGIDDFIFVIMINNIPNEGSSEGESAKIRKRYTDYIAEIAVSLVKMFEKESNSILTID
ncbi:MAG: class A beta-lactamase-related serine hydrolase [Peptococcaceae bacterium]|nr:class A beta-lactamase-related serine hydrolase [Peptococcaceae bacterium]